MDNNYLYHCAGCKKPDTDYPDKDVQCEECQGNGGDCPKCEGYGTYTEYCRPIAYHKWAQTDAYGIYTGLYCDKCYKTNYPYKKGRYFDPAYCGETMEGE